MQESRLTKITFKNISHTSSQALKKNCRNFCHICNFPNFLWIFRMFSCCVDVSPESSKLIEFSTIFFFWWWQTLANIRFNIFSKKKKMPKQKHFFHFVVICRAKKRWMTQNSHEICRYVAKGGRVVLELSGYFWFITCVYSKLLICHSV